MPLTTSRSKRSPIATPTTSDFDETSILPRVPFIPDQTLKRYGAYCFFDTRFRRAARLLQSLWFRDQGIQTEFISPNNDNQPPFGFGSTLSADAADAGKNFINQAVHHLALREMLMREEDAAIDEDRLLANGLSSMPMTFNVFGPLALDLKLATSVFRRLLPDFVHSVDQIVFEHSPGRREGYLLGDRTAVDSAVRVTTVQGELGTIYIEAKYSESMEGPAARMRDRYNEASREVRLYRDPDSAILRSLALEQLWREHMLSQLAVNHGITSRAVFMAIGPKLNRRVQAAFRVYENELAPDEDSDINRVAFKAVTLEQFISAIEQSGAADTANTLWKRYCDFERVYHLAMHELNIELPEFDPATSTVAPNQHSRRAIKPRSKDRRFAFKEHRSGQPTKAIAEHKAGR